MRTIVYNKLVRDKIPEIILKSNKIPKTEILSDEKYLSKLEEKLGEELEEYKASKTVEELADIAEVLYALVEAKGITLDEFDKLREKKAEERGKFSEHILLIHVIEGDENESI